MWWAFGSTASAGLALSLALNGASSGGILVTPVLVLAIAHYGFSNTIIGSSVVIAVILLPAIALWIDRPVASGHNARHRANGRRLDPAKRAAQYEILECGRAVRHGLTAQVGFLVHQIAILQPTIGRTQAGFSVAALTVAAIVGRFGLGAFAKRLDMRRFTAWSLVSQAAALLATAATTNTTALIVACVVFGLSAGNLLTLPSLVIPARIRRALVRHAGRAVVGDQPIHYAFGPGLLGVVRDVTGGYAAALGICVALELGAAALILLRPAAR
jgi:sugar phosphate permease